MAICSRQPRTGTTASRWIAVAAMGGALLLGAALGGCSWFGSSDEELQTPAEAADPFADGMLKGIGHLAPPDSPSQFLSRIAEQLGWEEEVAGHTLLRAAVKQGQFAGKVEPYLLALFYKHGFSVLPQVGEGHQFTRDTLVRGEVASARFLVPTKQPVRIIFVGPVVSLQIIYPKGGAQPQVFTLDKRGQVAFRESILDQYLR